MRGRVRLLHPLLLAIFPPLSLAASNPHEYSHADLLVVLLTVLAATALVFALLHVLLRRWSADVRAAVMLLVVCWFFYFVPVSDVLSALSWRLSRPAVLAPAGLALTGWLLWWMLRRRPSLEPFSRFMMLSGVILVVTTGLRLLASERLASRFAAQSAFVRRLAEPVPIRPAAPRAATSERRDIYVIVLDEYANAEVLRESFGFDNGAFEDSLRALGFTIPRRVRSNYAQTALSLTSFLNFAHVTELSAELGPTSQNAVVLEYLIENNRTAAFFQRHGYRFAFFPSQWWTGTLSNRNADVEFEAWDAFDIGRALNRTDYRQVLRRKTLLQYVRIRSANSRDHAIRTFAALGEVRGTSDQPVFAFAHVIMPHPPILVDAACRPDVRPLDWRTVHTDKEGYLNQLRCANSLVLATITSLLEDRDTAPIIVIQGDHGPATTNQVDRDAIAHVSPDELRERMGAFGAYYLPAGGDSAFTGLVTPVNVMRQILGYYFDADLSPLPNHLYYSLYGRTWELQRIDELVVMSDEPRRRAPDSTIAAPRALSSP